MTMAMKYGFSEGVRARGGLVVLCLLIGAALAGDGRSLASSTSSQEPATPRKRAERLVDEAIILSAQATSESHREALVRLEQALALWVGLSDSEEQVSTLLNIGKLRLSLGEYDLALDAGQRADQIARKLNSEYYEARIQLLTGEILIARGNKDKAIESFRQAMERSQSITNLSGIRIRAEALKQLGLAFSKSGDKRQAVEFYERALPLWDRLENTEEGINTRYNLGTILHELGESERGAEMLVAALQIVRDSKLRRDAPGLTASEARILNNLGAVYSQLNEPEKALDAFNEAIMVSDRLIDEKSQAELKATAMTSIGFVYDSLGEREEAFRQLEKALPLRRLAEDSRGEAFTLNNLGALKSSLDEKKEALEYFQQALRVWEHLNDAGGRALALNNIGVVENELGDRTQALSHLGKALDLRRRANNRKGEASTLINIGLVRLAMGEMSVAIDMFQQALPLAAGDRNSRAIALQALARIKMASGNPEDARRHIEEAIGILETFRNRLETQELRASYLASVQDYFEFYIDLLMQTSKRSNKQDGIEAAFEAAERGRARVLLEMLNEANIDLRGSADSGLLKQETRLQIRINATLGRQLAAFERNQTELAENLSAELDDLLARQQRLRTEIRRTNPRYADLTQPAPLRLDDIRKQILDSDTALLEYALGEDRSYLWLVTMNNIRAFELPKRVQIDEASQRFYKALTWRGEEAPVDRVLGRKKKEAGKDEIKRRTERIEAGRALSKMILTPVAPFLEMKRLLIVADGALNYIPFASLPKLSTGGDPMIVTHEIVNLPSASVLAYLKRDLGSRQPAKNDIAVLADPVFDPKDERIKSAGTGSQTDVTVDEGPAKKRVLGQGSKGWKSPTASRLKYTRQEAERIVALAPKMSRHWLDFDANRSIATSQELSSYRIVHFATHGIFNPLRPELSMILLSLVDQHGRQQNGYLLSPELYRLRLPAELVVLSACETGKGELLRGEGVIGMTRGLMYAGARRTVVSLWSVSDSGTAELMEKFYERMLRYGLRPAAALRAAQIEMFKNPKREDPYYWSAFVLHGEW